MKIDTYKLIRAAATKPFGFVPYYPGPGLGGHCIPIDPFYLTWETCEYDINTRFTELAGEVNSNMPDCVVSKIVGTLNDRSQTVKGSRILVLGITYKKNIADFRESPSCALDAEIAYSDPHVPTFPVMRKHHFDLSSVEMTAATLDSFNCMLLATNHNRFDYPFIKANSKLLIDCLGRYQEPAENIVKHRQEPVCTYFASR